MGSAAHRRAALAALAALALHTPLAIGADPAPADARMPSVVKVGELPPPPPHEWADLQADLNDKRAAGNGLVSVPALEVYLNELYAAMKRSAGVPDWPGGVHIIADMTLNAAASASGNIYLHMGFIRSAETEDEIFAVLAHEFAHVYLNHQAAYEAHIAAANARFGLNALLVLAKKKIPGAAAGWGVFDNVALAGTVAHEAVIPVWQRTVEEQADMFGATLALRNNYSYPAGFKTFLERLATVEKADAERLAAAARNTEQGASAAPVAPRKTHADAVAREAALTEQVKPLLPRPRPAPRKAPWQAALKERSTAEVLAHFALLPKIEQLQAAGRNADALKLAQVAASGATYGDATMVITLADAMRRTGAPPDAQVEVLLRNRDWPERAWSAQYRAATLVAPLRPADAKAFIKEQHVYFGESTRAMPDLAAFYVAVNDQWAKIGLLARCSMDGRFRDACADRAKTDAERAKQLADEKAHEQQILNRLERKFDKALKFN